MTMATVRKDAPPDDDARQARRAALAADLEWLVQRQAEPRPVTEDEYDRIEGIRRETIDLREGGIDWFKTILGAYGDITDEFRDSRRAIGSQRAADARHRR